VAEYESLQGIATIGLAVDDVEYLLLQLVALAITGGPVVASAAAMLGKVNILWIVELTEVQVMSAVEIKSPMGMTYLGVG